MEIQYQGEHLGYGQFGNIMVILSFSAALLSALSYLFAVIRKNDDPSAWIKLARTSFTLHASGTIGIVILLYYLIHGHFFEYYYIWQHSNTVLPYKIYVGLFMGEDRKVVFLSGLSGMLFYPSLSSIKRNIGKHLSCFL
jgi:cytochrome c-type biogenesis protein CcmF